MRINSRYFIVHRLFIFLVVYVISSKAQNDSLQGFNFKGAMNHATHANSIQLQHRILEDSKRQFIRNKYFSPRTKQASGYESLSQKGASNCNNIGFEDGNINGWSVKGDYNIVSTGTDPYGKFPQVYPGGKYSLQLNNSKTEDKVNFEASATRIMSVAEGNTTFNLRFAFVILNFPHDSTSAARFKIKLRDSSSHADICADYNIYYEVSRGPIGTSNFSTSAVKGINTANQDFNVTYVPWQSVCVDLTSYKGKTIAITVSCDWCVYEVDWAYCYIDADCNAILAEIMCVQLPVTISGPPGLINYKWLTPQGQIVVSNTRTITVNSEGTYELHCNQTVNCNEVPFLYKYTVSEIKIPTVKTKTLPCTMAVTYSIDHPVGASSYTWEWQDSLPLSDRFAVTHVYRFPGTCTGTLQTTDAAGCMSYSEFRHVLSPPVTVSVVTHDLPGMVFAPEEYKTYEAVSKYKYGKLDYKWVGDNYSVADKYARINRNGVYIVEAIDKNTGCKDTAIVIVELEDIIPNVFTPNNDGVNDLFRFRCKRNVVLSITDRWGHLTHKTCDTEGVLSWDGTSKGGQSADGVYFYTITPLNSDQKEISGCVTLLR